MLSFFKNAARAASLGTSHINISLSTKSLLSVANRIQDKEDAAGGVAEASNGAEVHAAQKALFDDIGRAVAVGMTPEQVFEAIKKAVQSVERVTPGAELALSHVLRSAFASNG